MNTVRTGTDARPASESPFPYGYPGRVCYFEVSSEGVLSTIKGRPAIRDAVRRAQGGTSTIFAVWPGEHRSDLFVIDDIEALALAVSA